MTERLSYPALAVLLSGVVGATFVMTPHVAIATCAVFVIAAVVARGAQAALYLVLAAFPILPEAADLTGSSFLTPQRLLVGLLIVVLLAEPRLWSSASRRLHALRVPLRFFCAFLAVGVLSAAASPLPRSAFSGVGFYALQVVGVMLVGCVLTQTERAEHYFTAISIGAIVVALLSVAQYAVPHGILLHALGPVFATDPSANDTVRVLPIRVSGPLPHPVSLGAYGALTLPFTLRAAVSRDRRCAGLGRVAVVMLLVAIMLSQTRMAMIAALVVFVVWFASAGQRRRVVVLGVIAAIVFGGVFGASTLTAQRNVLASVFSYRGQSSSPNPAVQNIAGRRSIYDTGWRAFKARPILGYGMRVPTNSAQNAIFTQYGQSYAFESYIVVLPLEVGVLGVLAFLCFIATLVRVLHRHVPERLDRTVLYAVLAGGAALAVGSNLFTVEITYVWLLIGLVVGLSAGSPRRSLPQTTVTTPVPLRVG